MTIHEFQIDANGFRPLSLGMSRIEIDAALGEQPRMDGTGLQSEEAFRYYGTLVRVVMREDRAVEMALVPPTRVLFRGKSLFDDPSVWREIVAADGEAQETLGFIVLRKLGLTLTGFHDCDSAQLAITAFEPGRWNIFENQMQPLRL